MAYAGLFYVLYLNRVALTLFGMSTWRTVIKTVNSMARGSMRGDPKIPGLVKKFSRVTSDSRWTSGTSAKCLPFKSWFIPGNKKSYKEWGRVSGGQNHHCDFSPNGGIYRTAGSLWQHAPEWEWDWKAKSYPAWTTQCLRNTQVIPAIVFK